MEIHQDPTSHNQSNKTIHTNQHKGSLAAIDDIAPMAGKNQCRFHCQQNIVKMQWQKGPHTFTSLWLYNLLCGCKSVALFMATKTKYEDQMHLTHHHCLFSIANKLKFPAARCAQGNSIYMYRKSKSSGVESMNRMKFIREWQRSSSTLHLSYLRKRVIDTVRLTSIYYQVPGN